jgi:DNA-binding transcriptional regulator YiaG
VNKRKSRPELSKALIELRRRLEHTQESLARHLNVSLHSVALWETKRPPGGLILLRLSRLAEEHQHADLAKTFADAVEGEKRMDREDLRREGERWGNIWIGLNRIASEALDLAAGEVVVEAGRTYSQEEIQALREQQNKQAGKRIFDLVHEVRELAEQAQAWSWRNQR